jgi:hypothetical protein
MLGDDMSKIMQLMLSENTLGEFNLPLVALQQLKHKPHVLNVFF